MALFKFRKGQSGDESVPTAPAGESVDAVRRRARQRLIGAAVLVLIGIIAFPLLFDTQPRPIRVDIPIEIPDRDKAKPLTLPAMPATPAPVSGAKPVAAAPAAVPPASQSAPAAQPPKPSDKPGAELKPEPPRAASTATPQARAEEAAKPRAAGAPARYVIQVGAFADASKAKQARQKVERVGLKTSTIVADTRAGKRFRVRVGPFATRAEADKAASKIKGLDLPVAVLSL